MSEGTLFRRIANCETCGRPRYLRTTAPIEFRPPAPRRGFVVGSNVPGSAPNLLQAAEDPAGQLGPTAA